jgi:hypothetical protein
MAIIPSRKERIMKGARYVLWTANLILAETLLLSWMVGHFFHIRQHAPLLTFFFTYLIAIKLGGFISRII